jgi:hypothetical protein
MTMLRDENDLDEAPVDEARTVEDEPTASTPASRPTTTAGRAIGTVLGALALAVLLCADSLVQVAERQEFGTGRDVALAVTRPIQSASHAVGLHLPRLWLGELTGNDELPTSAAGEALDVPTATVPSPTTRRTATSGGPATTATTVPTTTTLPPRRTPTADAPLRVVMFGDSLMGHMAAGFERHVAADPRIHVYTEYHIGTGLARPDVLDWPAYLNQILPGFNPEVIYLAFGGNDDQDMQLADGTEVDYGTPEWVTEYTRRVALTMDVAAQNDRTVIWINMPAQGRERLNQAKDIMNAIAQQQAALRPRVTYLDIGPVLTPDGQFHEYLPAPGGGLVRVREPDGVHVSVPGGEFLAPTLLDAVAVDWNLVASPTTTTTTTTTTAPPPGRPRPS